MTTTVHCKDAHWEDGSLFLVPIDCRIDDQSGKGFIEVHRGVATTRGGAPVPIRSVAAWAEWQDIDFLADIHRGPDGEIDRVDFRECP